MARRNRTKAEIEKRQIFRLRIILILSIAGVLYLAVPLLLGDMGIVKYFEMLRIRHQVSVANEKITAENQILKKEIDVLRSDPNVIEKIAREQLGLVKDGEVVYQFRDFSSEQR